MTFLFETTKACSFSSENFVICFTVGCVRVTEWPPTWQNYSWRQKQPKKGCCNLLIDWQQRLFFPCIAVAKFPENRFLFFLSFFFYCALVRVRLVLLVHVGSLSVLPNKSRFSFSSQLTGQGQNIDWEAAFLRIEKRIRNPQGTRELKGWQSRLLPQENQSEGEESTQFRRAFYLYLLTFPISSVLGHRCITNVKLTLACRKRNYFCSSLCVKNGLWPSRFVVPVFSGINARFSPRSAALFSCHQSVEDNKIANFTCHQNIFRRKSRFGFIPL